MIPQTSLIPGEGVGNSIKLGSSFYSLVEQMNRFNYKMTIMYSNSNYLGAAIMVDLPDFGIRLTFSNKYDQNLEVIEVTRFDLLQFCYKGFVLNGTFDVSTPSKSFESSDAETVVNGSIASEEQSADGISDEGTVYPPDLKLIYNKVFGPTYPGKPSDDFKTYILSYPGISFKFSVNSKELIERMRKVGDDENEYLSKLLNWDHSADLPCVSVAIHRKDSWNQLLTALSEGESPPKKQPNEEAINELRVNLNDGVIKVIFENCKVGVLEINKTTQQDIINILGPPDDYFNKFDSRLLIHNHLSNSIEPEDRMNNICKFHNYFRFGIDFLYDLNDSSVSNVTGILKKVIIHNGGVAESLDFMKWNKSKWKIYTPSKSTNRYNFDKSADCVVDSSMYFREIPVQFFGDIDAGQLRSVLLNRNESEFIDNELDIINVNEVDRKDTSSEGSDESLVSQRVKTWGQSKLYGCHRCIFEVIDSNDCISSLMIY